MRRSLLIIGLALTTGFLPTSSYGAPASQSPEPRASATSEQSERPSAPNKRDRHPNPPTPQSSLSAGKRAALDAAKVSYVAALKQAQNGRDLAFADANANLMQSLQSAGKDKAAKAAARAAYKAAATGIAAAFKQAIITAMSDYKTALQTINGK